VSTPARERRLLVRSILASAVLGALGIVWGVAAGSQMILLDGVYAVVGIMLSGLLLWASALADRGPTRDYPFGLEAATPLAIGIQGFVLLGTLLYAAVEAAYAIRAGGSQVTAGAGIAYGVVVTAASGAVAVLIGREAGHSDLVRSEAAAWRLATWRGVGMIVGFAVLAVLDGSRWDGAAAYVDPAMVIVSCVALLPMPVRLVRTTVVELLEGRAPSSVHREVEAAIGRLREQFALSPPDVHVSKIGPKVYVEVTGTAAGDVTIRQEHEVRERLRELLDPLPYEVWLNLELHPPVSPPR
jgi:cation diffusion facilitator family transporter